MPVPSASVGVLTPDADVVFGGGLFPVFDFGHFGAVPTGTFGQLHAGEAGVAAQLAEPVAEDFACLVNRAGHSAASQAVV
jgi:hypothetical protein